MTYHTPTAKPFCWLSPKKNNPRTLPVRVEWAEDGAAACEDHRDKDSSRLAMAYTPTCRGCARKKRAELIRSGEIQPHPHRTGPMPKEAQR
jgi:hypothetical protein